MPACRTVFDRFRRGYERVLAPFVRFRWACWPRISPRVRRSSGAGPAVGNGDLPHHRHRPVPPADARPGRNGHRSTEQIVLKALKVIKATRRGRTKCETTLGYLGTIASSYPINAVYQWMRGPEDAVMWVALKRDSGIHVEPFKEELADETGPGAAGRAIFLRAGRHHQRGDEFRLAHARRSGRQRAGFLPRPAPMRRKMMDELGAIAGLRDVQIVQSLDYPTIRVDVDRRKAGTVYVTPVDVARSLAEATSSSRFTVPNFWADPKTRHRLPGAGGSAPAGGAHAARHQAGGFDRRSADGPGQTQRRRSKCWCGDVARLSPGTMPGEIDRYNMKRQISMTANIAGSRSGLHFAAGDRGAGPGGATAAGRESRESAARSRPSRDAPRPGQWGWGWPSW